MHPSDVEPFEGVCGLVWKLIGPENSSARALSTALVIIEEGRSSTPHYHRTTKEIYFVLDGRGLLRVDDEEYAVKECTIAYIPPNTPHSIENMGRKNLKLLVTDHPSYDPADTFALDGE